MFDAHAHIGTPTSNALVCTSSPEEAEKSFGYKYLAVGLIPSSASDNLSLFSSLVERGLYIGEIGIDSRYPNIERQIDLFEKTLRIAKDAHKIPTIHYVGHTDIVLKMLRKIKLNSFIIHSFTGSIESAREFMNLGGILSFSKRVLLTRDGEKLINLPFYLTETDMPTGKEEKEELNRFNLELLELTHINHEMMTEEYFFKNFL